MTLSYDSWAVLQLTSSQTFLSSDPFTILKIVEDLEKLLYGLYVSIFTTLEIKTEKFLFFHSFNNNKTITC